MNETPKLSDLIETFIHSKWQSVKMRPWGYFDPIMTNDRSFVIETVRSLHPDTYHPDIIWLGIIDNEETSVLLRRVYQGKITTLPSTFKIKAVDPTFFEQLEFHIENLLRAQYDGISGN